MMTERHPYTPSTGGLIKAIDQLRRSFPSEVTADTLRKLGIAPKNESYVINVLRFIGIIDEKGHETEEAARVFRLHDQEEFKNEFSTMIATAYSDLFDLHKDSAWSLDSNRLISYFRQADRTTDLVGRRQASTFQALSTLVGKTAVEPRQRLTPKEPRRKATPKKPTSPPNSEKTSPTRVRPEQQTSGVALTVRIEINLPADGDQATYDRIFKSLRTHLVGS